MELRISWAETDHSIQCKLSVVQHPCWANLRKTGVSHTSQPMAATAADANAVSSVSSILTMDHISEVDRQLVRLDAKWN
jgi:hypothetical protein